MSVEEAAIVLDLPRDWLYNRLNGRTRITGVDHALFVQKAKVAFKVSDHLVKELIAEYGLLGSPKIPVGFPMVQMRFAGEVPTGDWGDPLSSEEFIEVEAQFEHPRRFAAKVVGDSCYPALQPGDVTIWHSDLSPRFNLIVIAQRKGDHACTVKQLVYDAEEGRPRLKPVNPAHDSPNDGDGWGVIARLVAVLRTQDGIKKTWFGEDGLRPDNLK